MNPFHPDLRRAALLTPKGIGRPWLVKLSRWVSFLPAAKLPDGIALTRRRDVHLRIFAGPPRAEQGPVILFIHGGGYVMKQDDGLCGEYAAALGATVVSVDYRLAPEHPYPAALEDCFAAYEFVHREAAALGVDPARLIIAGQSAGGGLAAALVLLLHDRGLPSPRLQLLAYPVLDDRSVRREHTRDFHRVWDVCSNRFGWSAYLGGRPDVPDHAAPARRQDFHGLPPAWIGVGTLDLVHDEALAYAARLREAGTPVTVEIVEGAFHGFDAAVPKAPVSRRFIAAQVDAMRRALQP
jgi:acetyl esterase/lipase